MSSGSNDPRRYYKNLNSSIFSFFAIGVFAAHAIAAEPDVTQPAAAPLLDRFEIGAGYSYMRTDQIDINDLNGFNVSGFYNVNQWLALGGEFSGLYGSTGMRFVDVSLGRYLYLVGARVSLHPAKRVKIFGAAMVGAVHDQYDIQSSNLSYSAELDGFAMALGGGVDVRLTRHLSIGASADYVPTTVLTSSRDRWQDNWRASLNATIHF